jgi:hypothetical protein
MRFRFAAVLALVLTILSAAPARADLWQGAPTQRPEQFSLYAAPQIYFSPSDFQAFFGGTYGITQRFQLEARLGVGSLPVYFGAFGKYNFFSSEAISIAGWFGFHVQDIFNLDGSLIFSHSFKTFDLYMAPLFGLAFAEGRTVFGVGFVPGFSLYLARNIKLYTEFTIKIDQFYNAGSVGFRFFL